MSPATIDELVTATASAWGVLLQTTQQARIVDMAQRAGEAANRKAVIDLIESVFADLTKCPL